MRLRYLFSTTVMMVVGVLLAVAGDGGAPAQAAPGDNGSAGPRPLAGPTPITVGAGWSNTATTPPAFYWYGTSGVPAFSAENPFTFTHNTAVSVKVTDAFCKGDVFRVYSGATLLGTTSASTFSCSGSLADPNLTFGHPDYSWGDFLLPAGSHSINIENITNPHPDGGGRGYIRVDAITSICTPSTAQQPAANNPQKPVRPSGPAPLATGITVGDGWHSFGWGAGEPACAIQGPFTFSHPRA